MTVALSPFAGIFIIIIGLLFIFLFISWCCKMCSQSKESIVPLFSPNDPLYNNRFMTAVDVQTGLPVIIETVSRGSRNLVRVTSPPSGGRHSINSSDYRTTYGAIVHNAPSQSDIISRTPPPPYSTVCVLPPVWYDIKILIVNKTYHHHNLYCVCSLHCTTWKGSVFEMGYHVEDVPCTILFYVHIVYSLAWILIFN